MKYLFYDLETTGLTKQDEVIQFGGILTDAKLQPQKAFSFYCYTQVPIAKKAAAVHGITAGKLMKLSDGLTFEDQFYDASFMKEKDLTWISYSTSGFDERVIEQTLKNNGLPEYDFGSALPYFKDATGIHHLDAYSVLRNRCYCGRNNKLSQLPKSIPDGEQRIDEMYARLFNGKVSGNQYHDALYDAFVLWWIMNYHKARLGLNEL